MLAVWIAILGALTWAAFKDAQTFFLPHKSMALAGVLGLVAWYGAGSLREAFMGGVAMALVMAAWGRYLKGPIMGWGDVKLFGVLGILLPVSCWGPFFLVAGIFTVTRHSLSPRVLCPFGPTAVAAFAWIFLGFF